MTGRAATLSRRRRGRGQRGPHRARAGARRRRAAGCDPDAAVTALGTETRPGHPPHPGARLPAGADPAGAAAAQAQRRPAAPARPGARGRRPGPGGARARSTPTSSSGSAATSRCPPTSAARGRVPIVVHEANARAGPGQPGRRPVRRARRRRGARQRLPRRRDARHPAAALGHRRWTGRRCGPQAREQFGLPADGPVLLVFGGSQGARTLNTARRRGRCPARRRPGSPVLHAHGKAGTARRRRPPGYVGLPYIEAMDLAYAAADAVLCRCGGDDRRRGVGRRPARGLRPAAARQRRAGAQRRSRSSPRAVACWCPTPS